MTKATVIKLQERIYVSHLSTGKSSETAKLARIDGKVLGYPNRDEQNMQDQQAKEKYHKPAIN